MKDVVVDANVLGHAENPELLAQFEEASAFLDRLALAVGHSGLRG